MSGGEGGREGVSLEEGEGKAISNDFLRLCLFFLSSWRSLLFDLSLFLPQVRAPFCILCRSRTSENEFASYAVLRRRRKRFNARIERNGARSSATAPCFSNPSSFCLLFRPSQNTVETDTNRTALSLHLFLHNDHSIQGKKRKENRDRERGRESGEKSGKKPKRALPSLLFFPLSPPSLFLAPLVFSPSLHELSPAACTSCSTLTKTLTTSR